MYLSRLILSFFILLSSHTLWGQTLLVTQYGDAKFGYTYRHSGQVAFEAKFESALPYEGLVARVMQKGLWGLINRDGLPLTEFKYSYILPFEGDVARFCIGCDPYGMGGKWGLLHRDGKELLQPNYSSISAFNEAGYAKIQIGGYLKEVGYVPYQTLVAKETTYPILNSEQFKNPKAEVANERANMVASLSAEQQNVTFSYWAESKAGVVNKLGQITVEPIYEHLGALPSGTEKPVIKACVECKVNEELRDINQQPQWFGGQQGYVWLENGKPLIPLKYGHIESYPTTINPLAHARQVIVSDQGRYYQKDSKPGQQWKGKGKLGIVDTHTGTELVSLKYDDLQPLLSDQPFEEQSIPFGQWDIPNQKMYYGLLSAKGDTILPPQQDYHGLVGLGRGYFRTMTVTPEGERYGLIDYSGRELLPPSYKAISWSTDERRWKLEDTQGHIEMRDLN